MRYFGYNLRPRPPLPKPTKDISDMRSSKPENIYKVGGYIKGETEKAILIKLVTIDGCDAEPSQQKDHWFPLSQTVSITKSAPGSEELDEIKVKEWILRQKELV